MIIRSILAGPAAFRPRVHTGTTYVSSIEKGRPVLQGLLAIDFLAKEASYLIFLDLADDAILSSSIQVQCSGQYRGQKMKFRSCT